MTSSLKFGTSGLRGLVTDLLGAPPYAYARAFASMIAAEGAAGPERAVMIGRDLRASSPAIAATCAQAVMDAGLTPIDAGAVPTPALALAAMAAGLPSIMVTGGHIPEDRNGLKFYRVTGEINKADEAGILAAHEGLALTSTPVATAHAEARDVLEPYCERYVSFFGPHAVQGMNVGVYQHSSVGRDVIQDPGGARCKCGAARACLQIHSRRYRGASSRRCHAHCRPGGGARAGRHCINRR